MLQTESPATPQPSILKPESAVLLVNTKSRRGADAFEEAKTKLTADGIKLTEAKSFKTVAELQRAAQEAIRRKVPLVIAGGGDGTFSSIARYFVKSQSVLGVLPLGTGNAFARDLELPADVDIACKTIAEGRVAEVDLGYAGDDYFLNVATIGLTTKIAEALTNSQKKKLGKFVYAVAICQALTKIKPFNVQIETELGKDEYETLLFVLGNGRYHAGPFLLSPNASITEGKLTQYALASTSKGAFVKFALALVTGHQGNLPDVKTMDTVGGIVRTTPIMDVTVDGETNLKTPLKFSVAPKALRVLAPEKFFGSLRA